MTISTNNMTTSTKEYDYIISTIVTSTIIISQQSFINYINYPLVISHSHGKWPIEIDGLPIKMADLSMAMLNNQMVYPHLAMTSLLNDIPSTRRNNAPVRSVRNKTPPKQGAPGFSRLFSWDCEN